MVVPQNFAVSPAVTAGPFWHCGCCEKIGPRKTLLPCHDGLASGFVRLILTRGTTREHEVNAEARPCCALPTRGI